MKKISFVVLSAFLFVFTSCSEDDDMAPIEFVKYEENIKPIISANCTSCHSNPPINGAPMALVSYDQVVEAVQNRNLIGRVEDGSMPPGNATDLTAQQVQDLKDWRIGNYKE